MGGSVKVLGSAIVILFAAAAMLSRKKFAAREAYIYRWYTGSARSPRHTRFFEAALFATCTIIIVMTVLHLFGAL